MEILNPKSLTVTGGGTVPYGIHEVEEDFSMSDGNVVVTFQCDWPDRLAFAGTVLGAPATPGDHWLRPMEYADIPGLFAVDARIRGGGGTLEDERLYDLANVAITFVPRTWNEVTSGPDTIFYQIQEMGSANIVTVPQGTLIYASGTYSGKPHGVSGGYLMGAVELQFTRFLMGDRASVVSLFRPFMGCVNDATFDGWAAGTVLFQTYSYQETGTWQGAVQNQAGAKLLYRTIPWNSVVQPGTGAIVGVTYPGGGLVYPEADFSALIS